MPYKNKDKARLNRKRYAAENKEKIRGYHKKYRDSNSEECNMRNKNWREANPDKEIERHLMSHYGITTDEYNDMFRKQLGRCAICGAHQSECKRALSVDHDHETGKVRGLLCQKCNTAIGLLGDNAELTRRATLYLEKQD